MRLVIIESPYAGPTPEAVAANVAYARACLLDSLRRGEAPIASHLLYTQVLNDLIPEERALGIAAGLAWRLACQLKADPLHEILVGDRTRRLAVPVFPAFYIDFGWSRGMLAARRVYDLDRIGFEERRLPGYGGPTGPIIEGARGLDAPGGTEP